MFFVSNWRHLNVVKLHQVYISEEAEILLYVLAFLSVFRALIVSAISDKRWLASVSDAHSYHWGFFFGWLNFIFYTGFATLIFISVFVTSPRFQ